MSLLPPVLDGAIIQAVFSCGDTSDLAAGNPLENVQWFRYGAGGTPAPGGIGLDDMAFRASGRWASIWNPFITSELAFFQCTLRVASAFVAVAPNKYRVLLFNQWTDTSVQTAGAVAPPSEAEFVCYSIRKLTGLPGRGRGGHIRISGVPSANADGGFLSGAADAALVAAMTPTALNLNVSLAMAFSDTLFPILIDGKLINANPGHLPAFYAEPVVGFAPNNNLGSQLTRKIGRHRR
jgi:hypothetical protein